MDESSIKYVAFIVSNDQYEFLRVLFDLCNLLSVFQRYINAIINLFKDFAR